jgi:Plavaka transposase
MFCPVILGSDKTTVSVATGQNEYYPLYASAGVLQNHVRRAHRNGLALIGFLSIPKSKLQQTDNFVYLIHLIHNFIYLAERNEQDSVEFRTFRRQLFHSSLTKILQPLKPWMTKPRVTRCADGHFRRVIFGLGPYIADYPEQCLLACVVSGWCPK